MLLDVNDLTISMPDTQTHNLGKSAPLEDKIALKGSMMPMKAKGPAPFELETPKTDFCLLPTRFTCQGIAASRANDLQANHVKTSWLADPYDESLGLFRHKTPKHAAVASAEAIAHDAVTICAPDEFSAVLSAAKTFVTARKCSNWTAMSDTVPSGCTASAAHAVLLLKQRQDIAVLLRDAAPLLPGLPQAA